MKKLRLFISFILISLSLFLLSFVANASPATAPGGTVSNNDEFIAALGGTKNAAVINDVITLKSDIILSAPITITDGDYTINGAGCTIYRGSESGSIINLSSNDSKGVVLYIGNSSTLTSAVTLSINGNADKFTADSPLITVDEKSAIVFYKGTVIENAKSSANAAGILIEGNCTIYDTVLQKLTSSENGGAIYNSGELYIYTGTIFECSAEKGGAIFNGGKLLVYDVSISSCSASNGGAIYNTETFDMSDGNIFENIASVYGGGVVNDGTLNLLDGAIQKNSSVSGGGIYNTGNLNIKDLSLNNNIAENNGGGIYNSGIFLLTGTNTLSYDNSASYGGYIYNAESGSFTLSGGILMSNKAKYGGAVFNIGSVSISGGGMNSNTATAGNAIQNQ